MSNFSFILQARVGSSRLPDKMILPFYEGKSIFELLLQKLIFHFHTENVILATSENRENDILETIATSKNIKTYRGFENDVLNRFIEAAEHFDVKNIIRVCCDNPFLDINEIYRLIFASENDNCVDYISFKVDDIPSIKTHFGFWTEFVTLETLKKVNTITSEKIYHEHVTNYIYENPQLFNIKLLDTTNILSNRKNIRLTLDTINDFHILSEIYFFLKKKYSDHFGINEIIEFLDENSFYKSEMEKQIKNNEK